MSRTIKVGGNRPQGSLRPFGDEAVRFGPLHDRASSFQEWLSVFFISRGHYTLTDSGLDRYGGNGSSRAERKANAGRMIGELVSRGEAGRLCREGLVARRPHLDWQDAGVRSTVVRKLVESLGKPPAGLEFDDFRENGLGGLTRRYNSSPYLALVEAGFAHAKEDVLEHSSSRGYDDSKLYPWQLVRAGNALYADDGIREAAVGWLVWKSGKQPREMTTADFEAHGLAGLLGRYRASPYLALAGAGFAYRTDEAAEHASLGAFREDKPYPWEMDNARLYHDKTMRSSATKWLIWKTGKHPKELTQDDFNGNGLGGLIQLPSYKGSPYAALVESGHAFSIREAREHSEARAFGKGRIYPWEMNNIRIYSDLRMRAGATRWAVWRSGKDARDITVEDFKEAGLQGLLANHYDGSPFKALREAGEVEAAEEDYMRRHGAGRFA